MGLCLWGTFWVRNGAVCTMSPQRDRLLASPVRSRAYPLIDLRQACGLLRGRLTEIGNEALSRGVLISRLGYKSSGGGIAARTVAALAHYGLLIRANGGYTLSDRGRYLQSFSDNSLEFKRLLRASLETPLLFRRILDSHRPKGKVPLPPQLAPMLIAKDFGITQGACMEAAEVFWKSALFAEVLTADGLFVDPPSLVTQTAPPLDVARSPNDGGAEVLRYPIPLAGRRFAYFETPADLSLDDFRRLSTVIENLLDGLSANLGLGQVQKFPQSPHVWKKEGPTE
jgi:hypothetical protein